MIFPLETSRSQARSIGTDSSRSRYSRASSRPLPSPWIGSPAGPSQASSVRSGRGRQADSASPALGAHTEHVDDVLATDDDMFELTLSPSPASSPPGPLTLPRAMMPPSAEVRHRRAAERVGCTLRIFAFGRCTTYTPAAGAAPASRPITLVEAFGDYTLKPTEEPLPANYLLLGRTVTGVNSLALAVLFGAGRIGPDLSPQQILAEARALASELMGDGAPRRRPTWPSANAVHQPLQRPRQ